MKLDPCRLLAAALVAALLLAACGEVNRTS